MDRVTSWFMLGSLWPAATTVGIGYVLQHCWPYVHLFVITIYSNEIVWNLINGVRNRYQEKASPKSTILYVAETFPLQTSLILCKFEFAIGSLLAENYLYKSTIVYSPCSGISLFWWLTMRPIADTFYYICDDHCYIATSTDIRIHTVRWYRQQQDVPHHKNARSPLWRR